MNDENMPEGYRETAAKIEANTQLATPALSPVLGNGHISVPPYDAEPNDDSATSRELLVSEHRKTLNGDQDAQFEEERRPSGPRTANLPKGDHAKTLKLSPEQIHELVSTPESLPVRNVQPLLDHLLPESNISTTRGDASADLQSPEVTVESHALLPELPTISETPDTSNIVRPSTAARSRSSPLYHRKHSASSNAKQKPELKPLKIEEEEQLTDGVKPSPRVEPFPSPLPSVLPVPPLSLPTYLQLELSSERPSALYIHRSATSDFPYESSAVKFERLLNFLLLPPNLEQVLFFGAIACLDSWLYTFTILPLRFLKAIAILVQWWAQTAWKEARYLGSFVYGGVGRVWQRRRQSSVSGSRRPSFVDGEYSRRPSIAGTMADTLPKLNGHAPAPQTDKRPHKVSAGYRHRRTRSTPSALLPNHKADILQGLLIGFSCFILMWFDASRMYHSIRGQSAIKLYVIYNVLEVFDRLFSALGQDILECLFSKETLERNENGRSKIVRPLWMFVLALVYNVLHATALFYQVVTLNVAVNSYSNALLTLLMSNQFVEIKGTVFKKFEKENLFQLTCADIVERFQLWLMLLIIALRNIVEVGGFSINSAVAGTPTENFGANATGVPLTSGFVIPQAFTLLPKWTGEVLGPFLIVLGSEALVDWCKHAYIGKFNNVKPSIYGRFLDVLAKDYYSHAFADQNLTKRVGLPVIPLSCLFIRACMQTYHMFLATHVPLPLPSPATAVSVESQSAMTSPATTAALQHIDQVFRRALGRSSFGIGAQAGSSFSWWSIDDLIAFATMIIFFLAVYLVLLSCKLVLGMLLLSFARSRYKGMKERERQSITTEGRRIGGWGVVEVNDDKRRWIYEDDPDGLREVKEREERGRRMKEKGGDKLDGVDRYMMAAKRIW